MNRRLRGALGSIARDRRSGAAELALRAVEVLQAWSRSRPKLTAAELLEIARRLLGAQPAMAPLLRLANEALLAAEQEDPARALARAAARFRRVLIRAPECIARQLRRALAPGRDWQLATYSYSSTVLHALRLASPRLACVYCSEARPGCEGRRTAEGLARAGIPVFFLTDAALWSRIGEADVIVSGADAILPNAFANKVGTQSLVTRALALGKPVWVLADTTKFLPETMAKAFWRPREAARSEIWRKPANGVEVLNPYFERVQLSSGIRILTERGWMRPSGVPAELNSVKLASRLMSFVR